MINLKIFCLTIIMWLGAFCTTKTWAQKGNDEVSVTGNSLGKNNVVDKSLLVYIGGGTENPTEKFKNTFVTSNFSNINLQLFKPFVTNSKIKFGVSVFAAYLASQGNPNIVQPDVYNIYGQTATGTITNNVGKPKTTGFKAGLGPQLNLAISKSFSIIPILHVSYNAIHDKGYEMSQITTFNSGGTTTTQTFLLQHQKDTTYTGISVIPRLRLQSFIGKVGLWLEANYNAGPKIVSQKTTLKPIGASNAEGIWEQQQIKGGKMLTTETSETYSAVGFQAGLVFNIGKPRSSKKPITNTYKTDISENTTPEINTTSEKIQLNTCKAIISYPANGQQIKPTKNATINIEVPAGNTATNTVRIYKVSSNPQFYTNQKNRADGLNIPTDEFTISSGSGGEQSFGKPITVEKISSGVGNKSITVNLTDTGTYMAYVGNGDCTGTPTTFAVTSCTPTTETFIDSAVCLPDGRIKVYGHFTLNNNGFTVNNISPQAITNTTDNVPVSYSSFLPAVMPTTNGTTNFSFIAANVSCKKLQVVFNINFTNCIQTQTTYPCANAQPYQLPCCTCTFCDSYKNWEFGSTTTTATTLTANNTVNLQTTIIAPSIQIISFKAELISFVHISANGEDCISCSKKSSDFGNFASGTFGAWGLGVFPLYGANTTHHTLSWFNASGVSTNLAGSTINLTFTAPPLSSIRCCDDEIKFCIRYSFTTKDCKTCSIVKCYAVKRNRS